MIHLAVWIRLPDGKRVQAGELAVADPDSRRGGALRGEFQYVQSYLDDPAAFALDPIHLPLRAGPFDANRPKAGVAAVFEDSLPDTWGRGLLVRRYNIARGDQRVPTLLAKIGTHALGALMYESAGAGIAAKRARKTAEPAAEVAMPDLPAVFAAADRYAQGQDGADDGLDLLFRAGSSPGGARPKVLLLDGDIHYLAKFSSRQDPVDMVRAEAASLELARRSGLSVPDFRVVEFPSSAALLVRRFDIPHQGEVTGGRYHVVSLATLLGAENYYELGYQDIADVLRQTSDDPKEDLEALFKMAAFNAVLGNTDDHLKNFAMLRTEAGWHLAPAYDLVPDITQRREHALHFGHRGKYPDHQALLELAQQIGVGPHWATRSLEHILGVMSGWAATFQAVGMSVADIERLRPSIEDRLDRCAGHD